MKNLVYLVIGILFGIIMTKSEAISWYRIQEMFRFQAFHMYGIIGTALAVGLIGNQLIKRFQLKTFNGDSIQPSTKPKNYKANLFGGIIFGLGWALAGACPGPIYILIGNGFTIFIPILISSIIGALCYGAVMRYLPH